MKKVIMLVLALALALGVCAPALAVNEDIEGRVVIYTSMYPFMIDQMTEAVKAEFPNLDAEFSTAEPVICRQSWPVRWGMTGKAS